MLFEMTSVYKAKDIGQIHSMGIFTFVVHALHHGICCSDFEKYFFNNSKIIEFKKSHIEARFIRNAKVSNANFNVAILT